MKVTILKWAKKAMARMPKNEQQRIAEAIFKLPGGDVKSLKGEPNGFRLRVGKWRVIFQKFDDELIIRDIGTRGGIYK